MVTVNKIEDDRWFSLHDVRRKLHASPGTIYRLLARDPSFPRPAKLGRANRWSARELERWMDAQLAARADAHKPSSKPTGVVPV